ncbi:cation:proton antiporter [Aetokthonos hydrillicola Thurmond2011]|jgi:Kef-type K+ transport system membrane component KefB|uniref:Cation:proton antiporter n=1 Tax=Aetokthonos hydrillicola Thurmond2011 TaxID=2712845 RepID=A0AAP5M2U3_9CYAN|nr:cation:proton antiporter [Aetokthonos hydrillicola]MBO3460488.1 cation:proton antiporter [Aetokthonos hydrillicola CCALA 1050]MDR9893091.1 cation:proton antiporter [Aetokthonos hydrillicola Thurmond2011]
MPSNQELAMRLFLQLVVILGVSRGAGLLLRYLGQTQVVSEMIAGVLLGPSFFGLIAPSLQKSLFPTSLTLTFDGARTSITHPSMTILFALSQLGLVLYMFIIGLQLNTALLSKHLKQASTLSISGILTPMLFGGTLGFILSHDIRLFPANIAPWQAALFMASAMLITAFPMLARIIYESGIANTKIGTLTLCAAAVDDSVAWILVAIVLATAKNSPAIAVLAIGGGIVFTVTMLFFGRPIFRLFDHPNIKNNTRRILSVLFLILMLGAWFTDVIGIYSIFGAFMVGAVMPRGQFANEVCRLIEDLDAALLLPIFFVYSGLNTQIGLLVEPSLLWVTVITITIAFVSKGGACSLATFLGGGGNFREAAMIGALMNARGLIELILTNIGLENHLISPTLFTILVLMAIVTTVAASPLFKLFYRVPTGRIQRLGEGE